MIQKLEQGLQKLNLTFSDSQIHQIECYIDSVLEFNKSYNLMKADTPEDMAVNHILDSLAAVPQIEAIAAEYKASLGTESVKIGDIGSGGGCPGIPLAIAFPGFSFTLVERMEKRAFFLESVIKNTDIKNAAVLCRQADSVEPLSFDIEVFRAFHPFDKKITKTLLKMLKPNGTIIAYKARAEKIIAEMELAEVKNLIPHYKKIPLTVPFLEDHERNLVIIKK